MRTGDVLDGRFEVERLAEKGGMGAVYRARDLSTGHPVALKVLHPHALDEASRMLREAHALMALRHPGIVRYVSHGSLDDERPWVAMEWLDGEDLRRRVRRQALRMPETIALGFRAAEAVAHAHAAGIIHRDVKPSNIFLCGREARQIKLIDFGSRAFRSRRGIRPAATPSSGPSPTWRRSRRAVRGRSLPTPTCSRSGACCSSAPLASGRSRARTRWPCSPRCS